MRLNLDFLKQVLPELNEFQSVSVNNQIKAVSGYDEATTVVENLRDVAFPLVLIEDVPTGYLGFVSGFSDRRVTSIWVLYKANDLTADARRKALMDSFELAKNILRRIVRENANYDGIGQFFEAARTQYFPRGPIAQQVFGYEFMLNTIEEINLRL